MVVDTSALVAIALMEENWQALAALFSGTESIIAAPTLVESHMVLRGRLGEHAQETLGMLIRTLRIEVVAFGPDHAAEACKAFDRFGKGRHPASLNFGDCVSYATSKVTGRPLLYLGSDFEKTDIHRKTVPTSD